MTWATIAPLKLPRPRVLATGIFPALPRRLPRPTVRCHRQSQHAISRACYHYQDGGVALGVVRGLAMTPALDSQSVAGKLEKSQSTLDFPCRASRRRWDWHRFCTFLFCSPDSHAPDRCLRRKPSLTLSRQGICEKSYHLRQQNSFFVCKRVYSCVSCFTGRVVGPCAFFT